jgi:NADPH2:quinone reductase
VIFGSSGGSVDNPIALPEKANDVLRENKAIMGYSIGALARSAPHLIAQTAREALPLIANGHVRIDITNILPLEQAGEAHRRLESRATTGKLLLRVQ